MHARRMISLALSVIAAATVVAAHAQTSAGSGTVMVLPLVADIPAAYITTVFVQNTHSTSITLDATYYFSHDADVGIADKSVACSQLTIAGNSVATIDPYTQCNMSTYFASLSLGYTPTNIFGMMILDDSASPKVNTFYAYSRTAQPVGGPQPYNGFSVEAFPAGNFSSASASAIGLQASTTAPHYRSNCFVGALGETLNWQLRLWDSTGNPVMMSGSTTNPANVLSGTLGPYQTTRILDVFSATGAAGVQSNVRATFDNTTGGSAMIAFCTVETTDNGSADFRIAKSDDARDVRQSRQACYGMDSCGATTPSTTNPAYLNSTTSKNIHYAIFDQPDFVQCSLVSDTAGHLADLEIMLRVPGDPQSALQFNVAAQPAPYNVYPPYTSGGPTLKSFYIYTGEKSTIALGATTRWYIDVSGNQSSSTLGTDVLANSGKGIPYGISCTSGNGMTVPWLG